MLKQTQRYSGPGGSTQQLHHKHIFKRVKDLFLKCRYECAYDGVEIGSTGSY